MLRRKTCVVFCLKILLLFMTSLDKHNQGKHNNISLKKRAQAVQVVLKFSNNKIR